MREQFEQLDRTSIIERKMDQRNEAFPLLSAPLVGETLKNTPTCRVRREILKGVIKKKKKKKKEKKRNDMERDMKCSLEWLKISLVNPAKNAKLKVMSSEEDADLKGSGLCSRIGFYEPFCG